MQPYNPDHDAMVSQTEDDNKPLTPKQQANTWFERVSDNALQLTIEKWHGLSVWLFLEDVVDKNNDNAIRIRMLNDLPF